VFVNTARRRREADAPDAGAGRGRFMKDLDATFLIDYFAGFERY
jgi:hypothetical protein